MPRANRRSWHPPSAANLLVTVELDPVAGCRAIEQYCRLAELTQQLVGLFDDHRLTATWAVGDPAHSAATSLVMRSAVAHELAILGDPSWLGPTAGRTRFARELARRVSQARTLGINVVTLVPRVAEIDQHIDLVVKQGIRAVAGVPDAAGSPARLTAPRALHYGVWELPTTGRLPVRHRWPSGGGRSVLRAIRRAARQRATFHLVIDAPAVEQQGTRAETTIQWLLREVALLRDRGFVRSETLGSAAARLSDVPAAVPQRSILRRAG